MGNGYYIAWDPHTAMYDSYGRKRSNNNGDDCGYQRFSSKYGAGDVVTMSLDLDNGTIAFAKNNEVLAIAFDDIYPTQYRLAVCMIDQRASVEMINYSKI